MKIRKFISKLLAVAISASTLSVMPIGAAATAYEETHEFDATTYDYSNATASATSILDVWNSGVTDDTQKWTLSEDGSAVYVNWGGNDGMNHTAGTLTSPGYAKGKDGYRWEFIVGKAKSFRDIAITDTTGTIVYGYCYSAYNDGFWPGHGERSVLGSIGFDGVGAKRLSNFIKEAGQEAYKSDINYKTAFTNDVTKIIIEVENHEADTTDTQLNEAYYTVKYSVGSKNDTVENEITTIYYKGQVDGFGGIQVLAGDGDAGYANMKITALADEEATPEPTETDEPAVDGEPGSTEEPIYEAEVTVGDVTTQYTTLADAIDAVGVSYRGPFQTVKLLQDVTFNSDVPANENNKRVIIEGDNHTITIDSDTYDYALDTCDLQNVTLNINTTKNIAEYAGADPNETNGKWTNVTVTDGKADCIVLKRGNLENCTITDYTGVHVIANNRESRSASSGIINGIFRGRREK